jgi:transposase-like protein
MAKRRVGRYPKAFKQLAVERLNQCENIVALSQELGVSRRLLYTWREKLEPVERSGGPPANSRETTLRKEVSRLKRVVAEKVLEVDFFTGALHTVEARRQRSGQAGAQASTPTSGT